MRPRTLALAAVLPLVSCVSVLWVRTRVEEPVAMSALEALRPGADDLGACLAALGAPLRAFEHRGDGVALLWVWPDTDDWSIDVSVPLYDRASAELELDLVDTDNPGCVLWFDADLVLAGWRAGRLGDIAPGRVRPSAIE